jgi:hypothetical protein
MELSSDEDPRFNYRPPSSSSYSDTN